jgi:hypothetical protein
MDPRYIFAVQCHDTLTWWPRPPTSSFWRIDSLQILFGFIAYPFVAFILECDGTCISFSLFYFLQCQVSRTTQWHYLILSPPHPWNTLYCTQVVSQTVLIENGSSKPDYLPPSRIFRGPDYPPPFGPDYPPRRDSLKRGARGGLGSCPSSPPPTLYLLLIAASCRLLSLMTFRPPVWPDFTGSRSPRRGGASPPRGFSNGGWYPLQSPTLFVVVWGWFILPSFRRLEDSWSHILL